MTLLRPQPGVQRQIGRYYPQQKDPRLNEDLRLLYDHVYDLRGHMQQLQDSHSQLLKGQGNGKENPGGPSTTKITGLNVRGTVPTDQDVLAYIGANGDIEFAKPTTVNGMNGAVTIAAGANISVTPSPHIVTIAATAAPVNFADDETPGGVPNGILVTFTLAHPPSPAISLQLYLNGLLLHAGAGNDYTLSGSTITMASAPATMDVLNAFYRY